MRRKAIAALWLFGGCTVVGVLSAVHQYYTNLAEGEANTRWNDTLGRQLTYWFAWGLVVPLIAIVSRRAERFGNIGVRIAVLTVAAVPMCVVRSAATYAISGIFVPWLVLEPQGFVLYTRAYFRLDLITYAALVSAIVAAAHWFRAAQLDVELSRARLRALQMQVHPHFLFNTLNTIAMLIRTANGQRALTVLAELGDLLRQMLDDDERHEVPLREELRFLEGYLGIERARFPDLLQVDIQIDSATLDAHVPRLILQPLVENAIRHGIAKNKSNRVLSISGQRSGSSLALRVCDNGPGPVADATDGVGLANTRERLRHLYGDKATFSLTPANGGGAVATIVLPWHTS
ncbi:MAG TPA: histidine kinase [Gemmatimonadaceae bacterium]|nr:histidine kinase [Gemmatimonadaceae bacterium]